MTPRAGEGGYGGSLSRRSRTWARAAPPAVLVTTARESSALDERSIAAGIPSRALMQRAGAAAAGEIVALLRATVTSSVVIYAGTGNNGGDGWVVARSLAAAGVPVGVIPVGDTRTDDARAERALAEREPLVSVIDLDEDSGTEARAAPALIVDALLGTGAKGAPRDPAARAIACVARSRELGSTVVALDIPSGVDADSGAADGAVRADVTLTFGTIKRGLLVARALAGRIVLLDIGLARAEENAVHSGKPRDATGDAARDPGSDPTTGATRHALLVDGRWVRSLVPPFEADAHKGTRKKLVIVGGQLGMAGAPVLAARAAMRSGIGMVRLVVAPGSLQVVQSSEPHALARAWPRGDGTDGAHWDDAIGSWADVVLIGPGLGASSRSREMVERVLQSWAGPVVLDADALNVFAGEPESLAKLLDGRPALLTPHVMEFSRLSGLEAADVLARRFEVGVELARRVGAAVLLKGVPTIVAGADGTRLVSAAGTPALAAAGSGDLLGGIAATLLAQLGDAPRAGAAAAWVHGRASEIAEWQHARKGRHGWDAVGSARGVTLGDIEEAIARVWAEEAPPPRYPAVAELPAVGEV